MFSSRRYKDTACPVDNLEPSRTQADLTMHRETATRGLTCSDPDVFVHRTRLSPGFRRPPRVGAGAVGSSGEQSVFRDRSRATGQHPSGAAYCQRCGQAATLEAAHGPDWTRTQMTLEMLCTKCAARTMEEARRFRLTMVLRPYGTTTVSET